MALEKIFDKTHELGKGLVYTVVLTGSLLTPPIINNSYASEPVKSTPNQSPPVQKPIHKAGEYIGSIFAKIFDKTTVYSAKGFNAACDRIKDASATVVEARTRVIIDSVTRPIPMKLYPFKSPLMDEKNKNQNPPSNPNTPTNQNPGYKGT